MEDSKKSFRILRYVPLAIMQATAFTGNNRTNVSEYYIELEICEGCLMEYLGAGHSKFRLLKLKSCV